MKIYKILITIAIATLFIGCGGGDSFDTTINTTQDEVTTTAQINADISQDNSIEIYWDAQQNASSYILEYGEKENGLDESVTLSSKSTRYKLEDLDSDTIYVFRLTTIFEDGEKSSSDILEAKTNTINKITKSDTGIKP